MEYEIYQCSVNDLETIISIGKETFLNTFGKENNEEIMCAYINEAFSKEKIIKEIKAGQKPYMAETAAMFNTGGHTGQAQYYCGKRIEHERYADKGCRGRFTKKSGDGFWSGKKRQAPPCKHADDKKQRKRQNATGGKTVQPVYFPGQFLPEHISASPCFIAISRQLIFTRVCHAIPDRLNPDGQDKCINDTVFYPAPICGIRTSRNNLRINRNNF